MRLAGGGGRSASLTQEHVQEDRRLHAGWGPMAGEEGRLCSRSRVAGKRRGVEPWRGRGVVCGERERRCERESVVDWMDVFLPLLRGVHSTPDSLSERSPSLSLCFRGALHLTSLWHYSAAATYHFTGVSQIQSSACQEKSIENEKKEKNW